MKKEIIFVSGIDTAIGKSYATGFLTREWNPEVYPDRQYRNLRRY